MENLLRTPLFTLECREEVRRAVRDYSQGAADFPDCLIGRLAEKQGCATMYTFDHGLQRLARFTVLK